MEQKILKIHITHKPEDCDMPYLTNELDESIALSFGHIIEPHTCIDVFVNGTPKVEQLQNIVGLKTLVIPYAGVPASTVEVMKDYPQVKVYNLHHNAAPTAEMAIALLLCAAKFVISYDTQLRDDDWTGRYEPNPSVLLEGKTAVVLGFGSIGQRVGKALDAMGVKVVGIKQNADGFDCDFAEVHPPEMLHKCLPEANFLVVTLPLTLATKEMIGKHEIELLPKDSVLVNVARGAVVKEEALFRALKSGKLAGAGIDVWYNYPKSEEERSNTEPSRYPFNELPNVVMSPHRAGHVKETEKLRMEHLKNTLNRLARGEEPPHRVDMERGY